MKKLTSFFLLFLSSCSLLPQAEEPKFLNPLFYQPMEYISYFNKDSELFLITPTSLYVQNAYGYHASAQCEMLENTINTVVLKCLYQPEEGKEKQEFFVPDKNSPPETWTYKFYIWPQKEQPYDDATLLRIYNYYGDEYTLYKNDKDYSSYHPYIIYNSPKNYIPKWGDLVTTHHKDITNINELILPSQ